jgi:hypothetical protein
LSERGLSRRSFFAATSAVFGAPPPEAPAPHAWESFEFAVPTDEHGARRALVALPKTRAPGVELPVLVLLHGLGETRSEEAGSRAWLEPYGLGSAWDRLAAPPLVRERPSPLSDEDYAALDRSLAERPFAGLCVVCPYLPNPHGKFADPNLERYARWLDTALLPALRDRVPEATRTPARTGIAGVSLGGFAAIEISLRRPSVFGTLASVQGAFGVERAVSYARALAPVFRGKDASVYVATSRFDPYKAANLAFARELADVGVERHLELRNGAHTQERLRQVGSLDLLLWHDRALRRPLTPKLGKD